MNEKLGRHKDAERIYLEVIENHKNILPNYSGNRVYATALNNIGFVYTSMAEYVWFRRTIFEKQTAAEPRYLAFTIFKKSGETVLDVIDLGEANTVDEYINEYKKLITVGDDVNNEAEDKNEVVDLAQSKKEKIISKKKRVTEIGVELHKILIDQLNLPKPENVSKLITDYFRKLMEINAFDTAPARFDIGVKNKIELLKNLPLPVSQELINEVSQARKISELVEIFGDYKLFVGLFNHSLLPEMVEKHLRVWAEITIKYELKKSFEGFADEDFEKKYKELERGILDNIQKHFRSNYSRINYENVKEWLKELSQKQKSQLIGIIDKESFNIYHPFCSNITTGDAENDCRLHWTFRYREVFNNSVIREIDWQTRCHSARYNR